MTIFKNYSQESKPKHAEQVIIKYGDNQYKLCSYYIGTNTHDYKDGEGFYTMDIHQTRIFGINQPRGHPPFLWSLSQWHPEEFPFPTCQWCSFSDFAELTLSSKK